MIELPADLAEVLKTVQSNENGADITFPDGDEELLADLAAAWDKWNQVADSHVVAIVEAAQRAMTSMSGPAADSFHQYLQKFAGGEGSHVATTLQSGHTIATSLQGASRAVSDAKNEMIRELQYAKEYMEAHPAGKHDDIAQSEGVKEAAAVYHRYIGQVGGHVDTTLRQSADHIADMTGMGQTCTLNGTTASGSSGTGGIDGAGGAGGAGSGIGVMSDRVGATLPGGSFAPGTAGSLPGGAFAGSGDPSAFSLPGTAGGGVGGAGSFDRTAAFGGLGPVGGAGSFDGAGSVGGAGSFGGAGGYTGGGGSGGSGGGSGLAPFTPLTPNMPSFGSGSGSDGGGAPVFTPLSTGSGGSLGLAGLGDLGTGGTATTGYTPSSSLGLGLGTGGGTGGLGGSVPGNIGSALGNTLGSFGGSGSSTGRAGLTPFGRTGSSPFGLGAASGRGTGTGGSAGGSALAGRAGGAGAGSANGMSGAGAGVGRAGAGTSGTGGTTGRSGATGAAAGGHMPGAGGMGGVGRGGGGKDGKHGNRFVSPTRFGGEEDEELYGDSGILGQATDVGPRDRHWHRARRRWLDDARADGTFATPMAEQAATAAAPANESEVLNQLAGVLLAGGATAADATGTGGAGTETSPRGEAAPDLTARQDTAATAAAPVTAATAPTETPRGGNDDAYLERARSAAVRRGHPDAPEAAPAASAASGASTAGAGAGAAGAAAPQRTPLREEGGYQVPSPFLRAALSRLAAPAAD
ncbi:hypothetical protein KNE206_66720 [Kitasatospora sp. NE20-6]|uniref:WXG100-like domain-containing protein n=1 Tax=Kitasatospora sp. NE20-6 TaxID=2859066 RepID=UPI0034DC52A2